MSARFSIVITKRSAASGRRDVSFLYEEYDPPHGDSNEGYWQVHLARGVDPRGGQLLSILGS